MSCCVSRVDGAAAGGGATLWTFAQYELDFSAQANLTIASGNNTIDGETWRGNAVGTQTFAIVNGSGLTWDINGDATATSFTATTQTACWIGLDLGALYTRMGINEYATLLCEAYYSTLSITTNTSPGVTVGLVGLAGTPTSSAGRIAGNVRARVSNVQVWRSRGTTDGFNGQNPADADYLSFWMSYDGRGQAGAAVWGGTWPTRPTGIQGVNDYQVGPLRDRTNYFYLAFFTGGVASVANAVVQRIRFSAWQPVTA